MSLTEDGGVGKDVAVRFEICRNAHRLAHRPLTPKEKSDLVNRYEVERGGVDGIEARLWQTRWK